MNEGKNHTNARAVRIASVQISPIETARSYLKGVALKVEQARILVKKLKQIDQFGLARRVLAKIRTQYIPAGQVSDWLAQQHALCTYKDSELPVLMALKDALSILNDHFQLSSTVDQETLGIAGSIHKRLWQATGQKEQLECSLNYYMRGYKIGPEKDTGYTAINAAFVLDQLADIEAGDNSPSAGNRRIKAQAIRRAIIKKFNSLLKSKPELASDWWCLVTIAEAYFGLGNHSKADLLLRKAKRVPNVSDWELRTTAFQLATLHQLQQPGTPSSSAPSSAAAATALNSFLGSNAALESAFAGKIGLALSGGGFRASLFHLGVLAALAERDLLRRVEVLSCVSGGSIIGAHFYLLVRNMLQKTDTEELGLEKIRDAYIAIVRQLAKEFLTGVQKNIRMRVFANPFPMLRAIVDRTYSRTVRLGELFERHLFSMALSQEAGDDRSLALKDLLVHPKGSDPNFAPKLHNWKRKAKVPLLILNATTLNTGHAWQYTASFMGESPWSINPQVDGTNRLRRMYHREAPPAHQNTLLGQAVVASACVPGMFEPIRLQGLYQLETSESMSRKAEPLIVRHVDGGVHDNQGIGTLIEQDCSVVLVSDASGQTGLSADPGGGIVAPLMRSNSVLMQRVRQEGYAHLEALRMGGLLKGTMFIHLKKDLDVVPLNWVGCTEPDEISPRVKQKMTSYGIPKEIQTLIASLRTDLDSFSDVEAFALATSGYRMASQYVSNVEVLQGQNATKVDWDFLNIEKMLKDTSSSKYEHISRLLRSGGSSNFRIMSQSRVVLLGTALLLASGFALAIAGLTTMDLWQPAFIVYGWTILLAIFSTATLVVPFIREHAARIGIGLFSLFLWLPAWFHLLFINSALLRKGRLEKL